MLKIQSFLSFVRIENIILTAAGISLGFWLSAASGGIPHLFLLIVAGIASTAFGNVINDIKDLPADRINRPDRALVTGVISRRSALVLALSLVVIAIAAGFRVSTIHGAGTLVPVVLLLVYTLFFKGTPLAGNLLVSLLVGYVVIFGSLGADSLKRVLIPSLLAFILNLAREIVKDLEDVEGDKHAGYATTAILPAKVIGAIIIILSGSYLILLPLPFTLGDFSVVYGIVCLVAVLPFHAWWFIRYFQSRTARSFHAISTIIKWEMVAGLLALAIDQIVTG